MSGSENKFRLTEDEKAELERSMPKLFEEMRQNGELPPEEGFRESHPVLSTTPTEKSPAFLKRDARTGPLAERAEAAAVTMRKRTVRAETGIGLVIALSAILGALIPVYFYAWKTNRDWLAFLSHLGILASGVYLVAYYQVNRR